jgi:hypothetical protein
MRKISLGVVTILAVVFISVVYCQRTEQDWPKKDRLEMRYTILGGGQEMQKIDCLTGYLEANEWTRVKKDFQQDPNPDCDGSWLGSVCYEKRDLRFYLTLEREIGFIRSIRVVVIGQDVNFSYWAIEQKVRKIIGGEE